MKILFVTSHTYLPERVGGSESSTHELALELKKLKHEVAVLARTTETISPKTITIDIKMGYPVFRNQHPLESIEAAYSEFHPDWIVGNHELTRHAVIINRVKALTCIYLRDAEFSQSCWRLKELKSSTVIANSNFVARRALALFNINPTTIYPLVNKEKYLVKRKEKNILFVNPIPKKGFETALSLARARPELQFDFVECWPQDQDQVNYYKSQTKQLHNIKWHSPVLDMRQIYRNAAILIVPSIWEEAWGRVVLEAQVNGIPVIASNRGGLIESVGKGGILVNEYEDVNAWLKALDRLNEPSVYAKYSHAALENSNTLENNPATIAKKFIGTLNCGFRTTND